MDSRNHTNPNKEDEMGYHFRNLVFEGGGVRGTAYVGALEELESRGILQSIHRVGGTSIGAVTATLVALNYSVAEIGRIVRELDFRSILDDSWGMVRDLDRLLREYGWCKGDRLRKLIGERIAAKTGRPDLTFGELAAMKSSRGFRDPYFIGANLSTRFEDVYSSEHTPGMCVADAVRISMSLPLIFAARRNVRGDVCVDGGTLDIYPVKLFDQEKYVEDPRSIRTTDYYEREAAIRRARNPGVPRYIYNRETLGFRLDSKEEISVFKDGTEPLRHQIKDFFDFCCQLYMTMQEAQSNTHLHSDDWQRTIYIDTLGIEPTQFNLGDELKEKLIASGRIGVAEYFKWFDGTEETVNRPYSQSFAVPDESVGAFRGSST